MYKWLIFILITITSNSIVAQKRLTAGYLDTLTYKKYMEGDWNAVIKYGSYATKHHVDFYYLRCRIGYAYYMKKEFRASAYEYERALKIYPNGIEALEYLYKCYIENQEFDRASNLYKHFPEELKTRIHSNKIPIIKNLQMTHGIKHTNFAQSLRDMNFTNISIGHRLGDGISLFHQYSYINQDIYSSAIRQHQYYVSAHIPLKFGWQVMPGFQFIKSNILAIVPSPPYTASLAMIDSSNSFLGSILISKSAKSWEAGYNVSLSNLNYGTQIQNTLFGYFFPLKNNQLSIGLNFSILNQLKQIQFTEKLKNNQTKVSQKDSFWYNAIPKIQVTYKPIKALELQAFYLYSNTQNNNELNGLLINNSIDKTIQKMGIHLQWNIYNSASVFMDYQFENKHRDISTFYNYNTTKVETAKAFDYFNHIVFGGIKINLY